MIRDRLVCGVNDNRIQRALLQETELTYEKALDIAQGIEAASKDVQKLQQQPTSSTVQTVQQLKLPQHPPPRNHSRCEQQHRLVATDVEETTNNVVAVSKMELVITVGRDVTFQRFVGVAISQRTHHVPPKTLYKKMSPLPKYHQVQITTQPLMKMFAICLHFVVPTSHFKYSCN